jgi:farnesyl-diphosphate farnesyltransferase
MAQQAQERLFSFLSATSRSFYLGIIGLQSPQKEYICNAYLFCRLMDLLEDATHAPLQTRIELLKILRTYLSNLKKDKATLEVDIRDFTERAAQRLPDFARYFSQNAAEKPLYEEAELLLREISQAPLAIRSAFSDSLMDMALGMEEELQSSSESRRERSLRDFDQYCYIVAGTVGIFLTRIFWDAGAFVSKAQLNELEDLGESFGKALQIVNITKDFHKDWKEGRCYWPKILPPGGIETLPPSYEALKESFHQLQKLFEEHSTCAQKYIDQLDSRRNDIRFFCAFPIEMARKNMEIASLSLDWLSKGGAPKVSKTDTLLLIQKLTLKYALPKIL